MERGKGIGGWLLFLIVTLVFLSPLKTIFDISNGYYIVEGFFHWGLFLIDFGLVIWAITVGIFIWNKHPNAILRTKEYLLASVGIVVFYSLVAFTIGGWDSEISSQLRISLISFGIWFSYLSVSKRVKSAFKNRKLKIKRAILIVIISILVSFALILIFSTTSLTSEINNANKDNSNSEDIINNNENSELSVSEIYQLTKNSLYLLDVTCSYEVSYDDFTVNHAYDEEYDELIITIDSLTEKYSNKESYILGGSGFLLNNNLYSNNHVIDCDYEFFQEDDRYYYWTVFDDDYAGYLVDRSYIEFDVDKNFDEIINEIYDPIEESNENYEEDSIWDKELIESYVVGEIAFYLSENLVFEGIDSEKIIHAFHSFDGFVGPIQLEVLEKGNNFPDKDFAIFSISQNQDSLISNTEQIDIGKQIYVMGFPDISLEDDYKREESIITSGIISSIKESSFGVKYFVIDAAAYYGSSGGPILDSKGKVIGILTAGEDDVGLNYMLPLSEI